MTQAICTECGKRPAGLRKNGKLINIRGFDLCPECNKKALDGMNGIRPKFSGRTPESINKPKKEFYQDREQIRNGVPPSEVDPLYHRRKVIFSES